MPVLHRGIGLSAVIIHDGACGSAQAPLTRQHYTVDMFLAVIIGSLVWHGATRWTYEGAPTRQRHPKDPSDPRQRVLTALILGVLGIVGYIIIVGGA